MKCPKCGGKFSPVKNTTVTEENEVYRRRRCKSCGHTFYTIEFQVEENELFMNDWYKALENERKEKDE